MKLNIGKKIGLGFATLLAILIIAGGYAVLKMRTAAVGARSLSDEYVAEWAISGKIAESLNVMMLNARTYGLTGEKVYLENVHNAVAQMKPAIADLERLSKRALNLTKLKEQVAKVQATSTDYEQAFEETAATITELDENRTEALDAAGALTKSLDAHSTYQKSLLTDELKTNAAPEKLTERFQKVELVEQIRGVFQAMRVANYRAQALHDAAIFKKGLEDFKQTDSLLTQLTPLVH